MKFALTLVAIGLLALGCSKQSTTAHNKLSGTWLCEATNQPDGENFTSTVTVEADGKYVCHLITSGSSNVSRKFDIGGTWEIQEGFLIDTLTKHNGQTNVNFHFTSRAQIIQFSPKKLVVKYQSKYTNDPADGRVAIFQKLKSNSTP